MISPPPGTEAGEAVLVRPRLVAAVSVVVCENLLLPVLASPPKKSSLLGNELSGLSRSGNALASPTAAFTVKAPTSASNVVTGSWNVRGEVPLAAGGAGNRQVTREPISVEVAVQ
ncbi:hypothetical protein D3C81_792950 [compost metagenome]